MAFLIGGANSAADTGYNVANSCRFNDGDSPYLNKTITHGSSTSGRKFTFSAWVKKSKIGGDMALFSTGINGSNESAIRFDEDYIQFYQVYGGAVEIDITTSSLYRDPSAWMHVVVAVDTEQGTNTNRVKVYVNGTQVTALSGTTYPDEDDDLIIGMGLDTGNGDHEIGREQANTRNYWDGYMAEVCWIDGLQLAPTSFGEFDEDSPTIWKPIDVSGLTFGNNGAYLDFEDSSNLGNDKNGGTDFTENNIAAADQAVDTPTNNFATFNPYDRVETGTAFVFSEGNCKVVTAVDTNAVCQSSIAVSSGKWYAEFKVTTVGANLTGGRTSVGVGSRTNTQVDGNYYGNTASPVDSYGKVSWAASYFSNNGTAESYGSTFVDDDIIGVYLDLDNNKLYFSENGTLYSTTGISITAAALTFNGHYHIGVSDASGNDNTTCEANYGGCPAFAISSGNADDNGYGNFEYSPNITGDSEAKKFYALCTKNLAKYG